MGQQKPLYFTKEGYRYFWCEDDEPLCNEYLREINYLEPSKRNNPATIVMTKRMVIRPDVRLSENDRAPQLKLNEDGTSVTGEKGYCVIRATHGLNRGSYYFEARIDSMPGDSAARIGWGQCLANLQAPLGYDHYGYSWRSRCGTKFHQARGKSYDKSGGYKNGDTIGCLIEIPYGNDKNITEARHLPTSIKSYAYLIPAKKREPQYRMGELKDDAIPLKSIKVVHGSRISFFKNGVPMGTAFEDIFDGTYYPSISLYKNCTVSVNFGPRFKFPPISVKTETHGGDGTFQVPISPYKPISDVPQVMVIDHLLADLVFIIDKENDASNDFKNTLGEEIRMLIKQD